MTEQKPKLRYVFYLDPETDAALIALLTGKLRNRRLSEYMRALLYAALSAAEKKRGDDVKT